MTLLSTKILSLDHQRLLMDNKIEFSHYNALRIELLDTVIDHKACAVIVSSSNAIHALKGYPAKTTQVYCVGLKTVERIKHLGYRVHKWAPTSQQLVDLLDYNELQEVDYLTSAKGLPTIPNALQNNNCSFRRINVYQSIPVIRSFNRIFDAVLCFSPRCMSAFAKANSCAHSLAICIGPTTAKAAEQYFDHVVTAQISSVEDTVKTAIKTLNTK